MRAKQPGFTENWEPLWQCSKCKKWLDADQFYADRRAANRLASQCKKCASQSVMDSRTANRPTRAGESRSAISTQSAS